MGAGCGYTSDIDKEFTFWVEPYEPQEEDYMEYTRTYIEDFPEDPEGCLSFNDWAEHEKDHLMDWFWENLEEAFKDKRLRSYYYDSKYKTLENGLYTIKLEPTYYGDGLVFNFDFKDDSQQNLVNLAEANYNKAWNKMVKVLKDHGFRLRIATSGYTSGEL